MFARNSSERSVLAGIKEESTRSDTSSPFSNSPDRKGPFRVKILLSPAQAPFKETPTGSTGPTSSSSTFTHVLQDTSAPVTQEGDPTMRDGLVVTSRPSA